MTEGQRPLSVQDELTFQLQIAVVHGVAALVTLAVLIAHRRWLLIGLELLLAVVVGSLSSLNRSKRSALRAAPSLPFSAKPMRPAVMLLRPVAAALFLGVVMVFDKDLGLGPGLALFSMSAWASVLTARRLAALQPLGERLVVVRNWAYRGKVFRMPVTVAGRAAATSGDSVRTR